MHIDGKSFLMLVATLAAGGAAGYIASEKHLVPPLGPPPPQPPAPPPPPTASAPPPPTVSAIVDAAPPPPACDDSVGTPGDCPPLGLPTVEGGCGSYANFRCGEFKQSMKPRVAQAAVACLAKLGPAERCNAQRVNLCGHMALMNACSETKTPDVCPRILEACAAAPIVPSIADCERTLSGMNATGRERMLACVKKHCADKGLLFCEAVADAN